MKPFFSLFDRQIPVYGVMWFVGIFFAGVVALLICNRRKIERYDIVYSAVYSLIGGLIGSKLLFVLVSLKTIIDNALPIEAVIKGGFVFYGGLIGGIVGLYVYVKQFKLSAAPFFDVYAIVLPLGHAFGRIGCHFAGCCFGIEYSGPFAVEYNYSLSGVPINTPLLPIQLIESVVLIVIFGILLFAYFRHISDGMCAVLYTVIYSICRFALEFLRGDQDRGIAILSTSQWISILFLATTVIYLIIKNKKQCN